MSPVLILLTLLLPLGAGAEEIIGGYEVKPHSRPYMVFIKSVDIKGNRFYCGGVLVQDDFVLTAAHCRNSSLHSSMIVILGAHNIKANEETQQIIPVAKAIPHPDYNKTAFSSDIMLLKLESKANRTKAVRPLKLPGPNAQVKPGDVCSVAGWGQRSIYDTKLSARLREVQLIIQEDEECKKRFHLYKETTQFCAGDLKKTKTPFKGDSGGPFVCDNQAYGVFAYGKNETISSVIFTKVVHFLPWISRNMKLL